MFASALGPRTLGSCLLSDASPPLRSQARWRMCLNFSILPLLGGPLVAAVTQGLSARRLTPAEKHLARFVRVVAHRAEAGILVGTVTQRLAFAQATGAPEIGFASLNLCWVGCFGS